MSQHEILSLDDPRLAAYRQLKDTNATRWTDNFVAEGDKLVERLLDSGLAIESLLVDRRQAERFACLVKPEVPLYVVPPEWIEQIIGFNFHRGVLACARRPRRPALADLSLDGAGPRTLVVCPDVQDPENLGAILRNAAAFGVAGVLVGPRAADPFSRRVLRVSMGAALRLPVVESQNLAADLTALGRRFGFERWATVLGAGAVPLGGASGRIGWRSCSAAKGTASNRCGSSLCDVQLTIPMAAGTDSLNVAVASGIFLFELSRLAQNVT